MKSESLFFLIKHVKNVYTLIHTLIHIYDEFVMKQTEEQFHVQIVNIQS